CPPWAWSSSGISRYPTSIDSGSTGRTSSQPSSAIGAAAAPAPAPVAASAAPMAALGWDEVRPVEPLSMEVGYRLIPLVDQAQGGQLLARLKGVRRKLTQDLGFLIPAVHVRDNLELA